MSNEATKAFIRALVPGDVLRFACRRTTRRGSDEPWRADGIRSLEGSVRSLGLTESRTDMGMLAAADMPDTPQRRSIDGDSNFSDEDGGSPTFGTCEPHPQTARPPGGK